MPNQRSHDRRTQRERRPAYDERAAVHAVRDRRRRVIGREHSQTEQKHIERRALRRGAVYADERAQQYPHRHLREDFAQILRVNVQHTRNRANRQPAQRHDRRRQELLSHKGFLLFLKCLSKSQSICLGIALPPNPEIYKQCRARRKNPCDPLIFSLKTRAFHRQPRPSVPNRSPNVAPSWPE